MTLPQILDTGDGVTIDRELALQVTRHVLIALKLRLEVPSLDDEILLDLADMHVSHLLDGDHWYEFANQLVNEVLRREALYGH